MDFMALLAYEGLNKFPMVHLLSFYETKALYLFKEQSHRLQLLGMELCVHGHQAELFDSKVVTNLLDIILTKLAIMDCGYDLLPITHTVEQHRDEVKFSRFEDMKVNVHKDGIKNIESFVKLSADKNSLI
nr:hypothetical protein CFP56_08913 [Quercus suber]